MYTEFVRMLMAGGEPLDERAFADLWTALRAALRAELRRRGLASSPPSYLGIYGWTGWEEVMRAGNGGGMADARWRQPGREDALEELAAGCYSFIFVDRLRSLAAQLRVKPDVEGLVLLNVRHYVHELQRQHDPLGYRIFAVAREAVRLALARGDLQVAAGDPRLRNDTLLAFGVAVGVGGGGAGSSAPPEAQVQELVRGWNDRLLPDLVTAHGQAQEAVAEKLSRCLPDLRRQGIVSFRFKELIDPLKSDVRSRWAVLLQQAGRWAEAGAGADGAVQGASCPVARPDLELEERAGFTGLASCVAEAVDRLDTDARTRGYLMTLWGFLSASAAQDLEGGGGALAAGPGGAGLDDGEGTAPSHRKLARLLGIPRERLPELYQTLGLLVQACRGLAGAPMRRPVRAAREAIPANGANGALGTSGAVTAPGHGVDAGAQAGRR